MKKIRNVIVVLFLIGLVFFVVWRTQSADSILSKAKFKVDDTLIVLRSNKIEDEDALQTPSEGMGVLPSNSTDVIIPTNRHIKVPRHTIREYLEVLERDESYYENPIDSYYLPYINDVKTARTGTYQAAYRQAWEQEFDNYVEFLISYCELEIDDSNIQAYQQSCERMVEALESFYELEREFNTAVMDQIIGQFYRDSYFMLTYFWKIGELNDEFLFEKNHGELIAEYEFTQVEMPYYFNPIDSFYQGNIEFAIAEVERGVEEVNYGKVWRAEYEYIYGLLEEQISNSGSKVLLETYELERELSMSILFEIIISAMNDFKVPPEERWYPGHAPFIYDFSWYVMGMQYRNCSMIFIQYMDYTFLDKNYEEIHYE
ncbi:MAG: hypothetical protein LBM60_08150 [Clostridium sp.]|jgi:hypothetical protein|nr:hypothetical protein [Clostridium sp.]